MPIFTSFDDAWSWFDGCGELEPLAAQRERFVAGRGQFLAFQVPIHDMPVASDVTSLQDEVADIDGVDLYSSALLHISIRGAGFQVIAKSRPDEILREDVGRISERAASVITRSTAIEATIGPVNVFPDAVILEVHDGGALGRLRSALAVIGDDTFRFDDTQYLPHITIATFAAGPDVATLRDRLRALRDRPPIATKITHIELARWWFTGVDVTDEPERDLVRSYRLKD